LRHRENPIVATEHIGSATVSGLHDVEIVGVAQRSMVRVTEYDGLADLLQELPWFLDVGLLPRTRNGSGSFAVIMIGICPPGEACSQSFSLS
jgi:hypothetical protein